MATISGVTGFSNFSGSWQTIPNEPVEDCYILRADGPASVRIHTANGTTIDVTVPEGQSVTIQVCGTVAVVMYQ